MERRIYGLVGGSSVTGNNQQHHEIPTKKDREKEKEGERVLAPTRRPDGTLRKAIRIRAGYVPQDEVAIYQSKGARLKNESAAQHGPPGYYPDDNDASSSADPSHHSTKSSKRNQKKKEKKKQLQQQQQQLESEVDSREAEDALDQSASSHDTIAKEMQYVESLTSQMNAVSVSEPSVDSLAPGSDIDKKIRALKKKIRLVEAQQSSSQHNMKTEQLEKLEKVAGWREELKCLEDKKTALLHAGVSRVAVDLLRMMVKWRLPKLT